MKFFWTAAVLVWAVGVFGYGPWLERIPIGGVELDDSGLPRAEHCIHMNCFDSSILKDATEHPEKYPDLQVRVCGWNVRWADLSPVEKQHFIATAKAQE